MMVRCNHCGKEFSEEEIVLDPNAGTVSEMEQCPFCYRTGGLMDLGEEE